LRSGEPSKKDTAHPSNSVKPVVVNIKSIRKNPWRIRQSVSSVESVVVLREEHPQNPWLAGQPRRQVVQEQPGIRDDAKRL
jgi:hypothetical protein